MALLMLSLVVFATGARGFVSPRGTATHPHRTASLLDDVAIARSTIARSGGIAKFSQTALRTGKCIAPFLHDRTTLRTKHRNG